MQDSKVTKQVLRLAFLAETPEDLSEKLKETGVCFTEEEVKDLFDTVKNEKNSTLEDGELEKIAAGSSYVS